MASGSTNTRSVNFETWMNFVQQHERKTIKCSLKQARDSHVCVWGVCVGVLLALSKAILAASEFEVLDILLAPSASESDSFFEPPATPPAALLKASVIAFDPPLSDFIAFRLVALSIASAFRFDSRRLFVVVGAGGEDGVLADAAGMLETGAAPAVPFDTPRSFAALSRARTSLLR